MLHIQTKASYTARAAAGVLNQRRNRSRSCQGWKLLNAGNSKGESRLLGLYVGQESDQQVCCSQFVSLIKLDRRRKKGKITAICSWVLLPLQPPTPYKIPSKPISANHSPIFLTGRTGTGGLKRTSDQRSPSTAKLCVAGTSRS